MRDWQDDEDWTEDQLEFIEACLEEIEQNERKEK
jgi:hypothetical protein